MKNQVKLKNHIVIRCKDNNEKMKIGNYIHDRLRGNLDYIDNRIILNVDDPQTVHVWVYEDCTIDYDSIIKLALKDATLTS